MNSFPRNFIPSLIEKSNPTQEDLLAKYRKDIYDTITLILRNLILL